MKGRKQIKGRRTQWVRRSKNVDDLFDSMDSRYTTLPNETEFSLFDQNCPRIVQDMTASILEEVHLADCQANHHETVSSDVKKYYNKYFDV